MYFRTWINIASVPIQPVSLLIIHYGLCQGNWNMYDALCYLATYQYLEKTEKLSLESCVWISLFFKLCVHSIFENLGSCRSYYQSHFTVLSLPNAKAIPPSEWLWKSYKSHWIPLTHITTWSNFIICQWQTCWTRQYGRSLPFTPLWSNWFWWGRYTPSICHPISRSIPKLSVCILSIFLSKKCPVDFFFRIFLYYERILHTQL